MGSKQRWMETAARYQQLPTLHIGQMVSGFVLRTSGQVSESQCSMIKLHKSQCRMIKLHPVNHNCVTYRCCENTDRHSDACPHPVCIHLGSDRGRNQRCSDTPRPHRCPSPPHTHWCLKHSQCLSWGNQPAFCSTTTTDQNKNIFDLNTPYCLCQICSFMSDVQ